MVKARNLKNNHIEMSLTKLFTYSLLTLVFKSSYQVNDHVSKQKDEISSLKIEEEMKEIVSQLQS